MARQMEGSQFATGGLLVPEGIEDVLLKVCSQKFTAQLDDLIIIGDQISGTLSSDPVGIMPSTTDSVNVTTSDNHTTGGINITHVYAGTMDFKMTEEEMKQMLEILRGTAVERKRVIPKHRMIRED